MTGRFSQLSAARIWPSPCASSGPRGGLSGTRSRSSISAAAAAASSFVRGRVTPQRSMAAVRKRASDRARIAAAVTATQDWLGVPRAPERWMDPLRPGQRGYSSVYQSANRYAHLYWLRQLCGVEAWFCHLLFVDDPTYGRTSRAVWQQTLPKIEHDLGLQDRAVPFAGHVFLPGLPQSSRP